MAPVLRAQFPDIAGTAHDKGCLGTTLKLICLGLADAANEDGSGAHPGIRRLADFAQCCPDTAVRALHHLVQIGAITQTGDAQPPKLAATYRVNLGWVELAVCTRHRASQPRDTERASQPRGSRGPEPRGSRGPEPRSSVPPSIRPADEDVGGSVPTQPPWQRQGISQAEWLRRHTGIADA